MTVSEATQNLIRHLASRPGHDEVKADFRQLLIEEFGVELHALDFERRAPEGCGRLVRTVLAEAGLASRIDALVAQLLDGG